MVKVIVNSEQENIKLEIDSFYVLSDIIDTSVHGI